MNRIVVLLLAVLMSIGCKTTAPSGAPTPAAAKGTLLVKSTPGGAEVFINDKPRGKTPFTLDVDADVLYMVRVESPGRKSTMQVFTGKAGPSVMELKMPIGAPRIVVKNLQDGAEVRLDGSFVGRSKAGANVEVNTTPGRHKVDVTHPLAKPFHKTVKVENGQIAQVAVVMPGTRGAIQVKAPAGSMVWVQGTPKGQAPLLVSDLPPGTYLVDIHIHRCKRRQTKVQVVARKTVTASVYTGPDKWVHMFGPYYYEKYSVTRPSPGVVHAWIRGPILITNSGDTGTLTETPMLFDRNKNKATPMDGGTYTNDEMVPGDPFDRMANILFR